MAAGDDIREQAKKDASGAPRNEAGQPPCPCWELRLGIFFDGTANSMTFDFGQMKKEIEDENRRQAEEEQRAREVEEHRNNERKALETAALLRERARLLEQEARYAEMARDMDQKTHLELARQAREAADRAAPGNAGDRAAALAQYRELQARSSEAYRRYYESARAAGEKRALAEQAARDANAAEERAREISAQRQRSEANVPQGSSGESGPSNVAKLFLLYAFDADEAQKKMSHAIYIRGVGAVENAESQKEYTPGGQGAGMGAEGGMARIQEADGQLTAFLRSLPPDRKPCKVIVDVFGFSRGAALARHYVNKLNAGGVPDFSQPQQPASIPVEIHFVGLFDTVGSFGLPGNAYEPGFDLELKPGCARKVFHIVARHERRANFRYTSAEPVGTELFLDGVHSDIGGGYRSREKITLLMDKESFILTPLFAGQQESRIREAEWTLLARARARLGGNLPPGWFVSHETSIEGEENLGVTVMLLRNKLTVNTYANVALNIMYREATAPGVQVPFKTITDYPEYSVPPDLTHVTGGAGGGRDELSEKQWEKYIHVSACDDRPVRTYLRMPYGRYPVDIGMWLDSAPDQGRYFYPNDARATSISRLNRGCAIRGYGRGY